MLIFAIALSSQATELGDPSDTDVDDAMPPAKRARQFVGNAATMSNDDAPDAISEACLHLCPGTQ